MAEETDNVVLITIDKQTIFSKISKLISGFLTTANFNVGLKNKNVNANATISKDNFQLTIHKNKEEEKKDDNKVT